MKFGFVHSPIPDDLLPQFIKGLEEIAKTPYSPPILDGPLVKIVDIKVAKQFKQLPNGDHKGRWSHVIGHKVIANTLWRQV